MKLEIKNTDGIGVNTKVFDDSGKELTGLLRPTHISLDMHDLVRATVDIIMPVINVNTVTEAEIYMENPKTGERERLLALEFESGRVEL